MGALGAPCLTHSPSTQIQVSSPPPTNSLASKRKLKRRRMKIITFLISPILTQKKVYPEFAERNKFKNGEILGVGVRRPPPDLTIPLVITYSATAKDYKLDHSLKVKLLAMAPNIGNPGETRLSLRSTSL